MYTDAVSINESYKSSSVTLNNDDNHHGNVTSIDSHCLNSMSGDGGIYNNSKLIGICNSTLVKTNIEQDKNANVFRDSNIETLNDMYYEPKDDQKIKENGGIYPWLVVLGTFLVLIVGLGAGSGW